MSEVPPNDQPKAFISYSRQNRAEVSRLRDDLIAAGFAAYLDLHDIAPGEPWRDRIGKLIAAADTVAFALSPASIASPIVDWEVNEAERLGKRSRRSSSMPPCEDCRSRTCYLKVNGLRDRTRALVCWILPMSKAVKTPGL